MSLRLKTGILKKITDFLKFQTPRKKVVAAPLTWKLYLHDLGVIFTFCLINFLFCSLLYALCFFHTPIQKTNLSGNLFSLLLCISHYGTFCGGAAILLSLLRLCGRKTAGIAAAVLGWFGIALLCLDTWVYQQWHFHINTAMIALFLSPAGKELVTLPASTWCFAILLFLAIGTVEYVVWKTSTRFSFPKTVLVCLAVFLISAPFFHAWNAWVFFHRRNTYMLRTNAVPLHFGVTANSLLERHGFVPEKETIQCSEVINGTIHYPLKPLEFSETARPNILFIVIDSLRADCVTPETMPGISRLAEKDAAIFTQHISGGNCTRTGLFTLFYGIPGNYWHTFLRCSMPSVVSVAAQQCGYDIGIFSSATLVNPEIDKTVFANLPDLRLFSKGADSIQRDQNAIDDFIQFLQAHNEKNAGKPFFSMLMLDSMHANQLPPNYPHYFPTDITRMDYLRMNGNDPALALNVLNFFKNQARFMDEVLSKVFSRMEKAGGMKNTIIILTGDHGQEANDTRTNSWEHNSNFTRYQTQVPMIVWGIPGKQGRFAHRTTHFDVSVTLLSQMGCRNPSEDFSVGKDLFDPSDRPFILLSNYSGVAFLCGDNVFELRYNGTNMSYDVNGKHCDFVPDRTILQQYMQQSKQFF